MPLGLCECGCGQRTTISTYNDVRFGIVKGMPRKRVRWHGGKGRTSKTYPTMAVGGKHAEYVHRVRVERALGRLIPVGAEVHHADGSKSASAQLVLCQDSKYHKLLHVRTRVIRAGGNPNTDKICCHCKLVKHVSEFGSNASKWDGLHSSCRRCACAEQRAIKARKKAA